MSQPRCRFRVGASSCREQHKFGKRLINAFLMAAHRLLLVLGLYVERAHAMAPPYGSVDSGDGVVAGADVRHVVVPPVKVPGRAAVDGDVDDAGRWLWRRRGFPPHGRVA